MDGSAINVAWGNRLRRLREQRGVKRERVALDLDMTAENWRHYESGRNPLVARHLPVLARSLGIPFDQFMAELVSAWVEVDSVDTAASQTDDETSANYNYNEGAKRKKGGAYPCAPRHMGDCTKGRVLVA